MNHLKAPLNYGSLAGIVSFMIFLIIYAFGINPLGGASWLGAWVPIVFVWAGVKKFRSEEQDGYISYGRAFSIGLLICFIYASLSAFLIYIFLHFVDPGIVERHIAEIMEGIEKLESMVGEETYDKILAEMDKEKFTIGKIAMGDFQSKLIGGIIISLVIAAILKKSKPLFEA